jgi:ELWxxDGT repeat protein
LQVRDVCRIQFLEARALLTAVVSQLAFEGPVMILPAVDGRQLLAVERFGYTDLYTTDGMTGGTQVFATIPGRLTPDGWTNSSFENYALLDGKLYFNAWVTGSTPRHGLWKTDGKGAVLLLEQSAADARVAFEFVTYNGRVYFGASDTGVGRELWSSDGTIAGTQLAVDVIPGPVGSSPRQMRVFDGQLFFTAGGTDAETIYRTDGTTGGTILVTSGDYRWSSLPTDSGTSAVAVTDTRLILKRETRASGVELLAMSTATAAPLRIHQFVPVAGSEYLVDGFLEVGDITFFRRVEYVGGQFSGDLWKSDGTDTGTVPVSSIRLFQAPMNRNGAAQSAIGFFTGVYSQNTTERLVFFADARIDWGLWQTDGVTLTQIPMTTPAAKPIGQRSLIAAGGRMYSLVPGSGVFEIAEHLVSGRLVGGYSASIDGNPGQLTAMLGSVWFVAGQKLWQVLPQLPDALPGPVPEGDRPGALGTIRASGKDVFRLTWKPVPGAVAYRINGELSSAGTATTLDIPWDQDRTYSVRIQAVMASGQFSEAADFSFTGFLNSYNLQFSGSTAFTQQVRLRRSPGSAWLYRAEFLDSASGLVLQTTTFRWSAVSSTLQEASLYFPAGKIPASGRLSVRVSPMTVTAPINAATVAFDLRYSEIAVSFSGAVTTITWPSVAGPLGYDLWVNDETRGVSQYIRRSSLATNSFSTTFPEGIYRIWVRSKDLVPSLWSQSEVISVGTVPKLLAPSGTIPTADALGSFRWPRVQGAVSMELWVNRVGGPVRVIHETGLAGNSTGFAPTSPLPYGRYQAWIRSQGVGPGHGIWSVSASFTVLPPTVQPVVATSPFDRTPMITWTAPFAGVSYELWIGRSDGVEVFRKTGISGTSFTLPVALANGSYRVSLRGQTADGILLPWSRADDTPLTIGFTGTVQGTLVGHRTLFWGAISDATHYDVWMNLVSGDQAPQSQIYRNTAVQGTSLLLPATLPAGSYRLWIRAVRAAEGETFLTEWTPNGTSISLS